MPARFLVALLAILAVSANTFADDETPMTRGPYTFGPDSKIQPGVPQGTVDKWRWDDSKIYPNTKRDVWVYVPAEYDAAQPAALMVFQDGPRQFAVRENEVNKAARYTAEYRAESVLDNLIFKKQLPVMIAVFINPGSTTIGPDGHPDFLNRSVEYDTVSDTYSQFLFTEILPQVEKKYNLRKDPAGRGIGGISSGAICAFTVAWNHPDQFSKVLSDVGSFTNIRGGDAYPKLVLDADRKPIRVAMQDGTNDNRNPNDPTRDWHLQNELLFHILTTKGYDVRYVLGDGKHDSQQGGSIFPDTMRWLWQDQVPATQAAATTQPAAKRDAK
jgi:enterochelin esterase family protein